MKGLPNPAECQRATDLFLKTQWLLARGGGIVFATGTPIATPTEESFFEAIGVPWIRPEDRTG